VWMQPQTRAPVRLPLPCGALVARPAPIVPCPAGLVRRSADPQRAARCGEPSRARVLVNGLSGPCSDRIDSAGGDATPGSRRTAGFPPLSPTAPTTAPISRPGTPRVSRSWWPRPAKRMVERNPAAAANSAPLSSGRPATSTAGSTEGIGGSAPSDQAAAAQRPGRGRLLRSRATMLTGQR